MRIINKIIYWSAFACIGLCILSSVVRPIFDIEFTSADLKADYTEFLFYAIPVAIVLTLFGTLKSHDSTKIKTYIVLKTIVLAAASYFLIIFSVLINMCGYSNRQELYQSNREPNVRIIVREHGCGATDSDSPKVNTYKVHYFLDYFVRSTKIDTSQIKKDDWVKLF